MFRHDTYIGPDHYWIRFYNGTHQVRRATLDWEEDHETVFEGHYEDCVKYIDEIDIAYRESILF